MANVMYDKALEGFLSGAMDLTSVVVKAVLVDAGQYTFSQAHDFLDDIPSGARIATSPALSSKTVTNGVFAAADVTISAVSGVSVEAIVLYVDTGSAATSRLICYIDTGTGLPLTPNGADVILQWNTGATKIFKL